MADTDEQTQQYIQALLRERAGYQKHGLLDRVKEVDAELKRVGYRAKAPAKRAERRSSLA
jgi:uncharacterized protein (UPF0335 family)